jgi:hypothetical protein
MPSPRAQRLIADITARSQATGWVQAVSSEVIVDTKSRTRVSVTLGVVGNPRQKSTRRPANSKSPMVIADETHEDERTTEYRYDFVDEGTYSERRFTSMGTAAARQAVTTTSCQARGMAFRARG